MDMITFDKDEYFFLAVADAADRHRAFVQMQELLAREMNREILEMKQELLFKLSAVTDEEYTALAVPKFVKKEIEPLHDMDEALCYAMVIRGILSEDGTCLRDYDLAEVDLAMDEVKRLGFLECDYFEYWNGFPT